MHRLQQNFQNTAGGCNEVSIDRFEKLEKEARISLAGRKMTWHHDRTIKRVSAYARRHVCDHAHFVQ